MRADHLAIGEVQAKTSTPVRPTGGNGNAARIEFLKQKLEADRIALAAEMEKLARKRKRDNEKLFRLAGETLLRIAADDAGFELALQERLRTAPELSDADRAFLARMGWQ